MLVLRNLIGVCRGILIYANCSNLIKLGRMREIPSILSFTLVTSFCVRILIISKVTSPFYRYELYLPAYLPMVQHNFWVPLEFFSKIFSSHTQTYK